MCGIAGYLGQEQISETRVLMTVNLLKNRGPDFQDYKFIKACQEKAANLVLIHTRLAIIDLDPRANQPFTIKGYSIVFNGEIYNFLELKQALSGEGYDFRTSSDTEVLLTAYIHYGQDFTSMLEGMWSLAIWDPVEESLILSRDRFGEKPLYYYKDEKGIYFSSEVKAIETLTGKKTAINYDQLLRYTVLGYKSLYKKSQTFFTGINEVPRASTITISNNLELQEKKYWKPIFGQQTLSLSDSIDGARHYLIESLRLRMRSDVPVAFCLSGGVDSAALVSIAAKILKADITTFSILEQDPRYNEYDNIMHTINDIGCEHHLIGIPQSGSLERLKRQVAYHDAPVSTISYFVHALLSEKMSEHGFKVAFSGTSADELFTGYYDHFLLHLYQMRSNTDYKYYLENWKKHISGFVRNPHLSDPDLFIKNPDFRDHVFDNAQEFISWLKPGVTDEYDFSYSEEIYCDSLLRNRMLNELFHEATPVILHEDDMNSMQYSVENRSPYLDTNLFNFIYSLPEEHLIRNGYGKHLLRESMKGILNDDVRLDRKKKGFNASIHSIIDFRDKNIRNEFLDPGNTIFEYLNFDKVANLSNQAELPNHYSKFMFNLVNAQIFMAQH